MTRGQRTLFVVFVVASVLALWFGVLAQFRGHDGAQLLTYPFVGLPPWRHGFEIWEWYTWSARAALLSLLAIIVYRPIRDWILRG